MPTAAAWTRRRRAPRLGARPGSAAGNNLWAAPASPPRSPPIEATMRPVSPPLGARDVPPPSLLQSALPRAACGLASAFRSASLDLGALSVAPDPALAPPSRQQRMSLDSALQVQQQAHAERHMAAAASAAGGGEWPHALAAGATAMAGIPVNEQPMLPNHGPRMSNAVARKLGLAPGKPPPAPAPADVRAAPHQRPPGAPARRRRPLARSTACCTRSTRAPPSTNSCSCSTAAAAAAGDRRRPEPPRAGRAAAGGRVRRPAAAVCPRRRQLPRRRRAGHPPGAALAGGGQRRAPPPPAVPAMELASTGGGGAAGGDAAVAQLITTLQRQWSLAPGACDPDAHHLAGQHGHSAAQQGGHGGLPHRTSSDGMLGMAGIPHVRSYVPPCAAHLPGQCTCMHCSFSCCFSQA